jgi:hypothetical protein
MNHPDWQKCENCYSFVGSLVPGKGTCQHNPPNADLTLGFPITSSHSWCRQWSGMMLEGGNSYMGPVTKDQAIALAELQFTINYPEQILEPQNPA